MVAHKQALKSLQDSRTPTAAACEPTEKAAATPDATVNPDTSQSCNCCASSLLCLLIDARQVTHTIPMMIDTQAIVSKMKHMQQATCRQANNVYLQHTRLHPLPLLLCCRPCCHELLQLIAAVALEALALAHKQQLAGHVAAGCLRHLQHMAVLVHADKLDGAAVQLAAHLDQVGLVGEGGQQVAEESEMHRVTSGNSATGKYQQMSLGVALLGCFLSIIPSEELHTSMMLAGSQALQYWCMQAFALCSHTC